MKSLLKVRWVLVGFFLAGFFTIPYSYAEDGSNYVNVYSCRDVEKGIMISREAKESESLLSNGIRDAGHGLRDYSLKCVAQDRYYVEWKEIAPEKKEPTSVPVTALPDFVVKDILQAPNQEVPNYGTDVLTIRVKNVGLGDAPEDSVGVFIWIDDQLEWTYSSSTLNRKDFLKAGGMSDIQPQILRGKHRVKSCVDYNQSFKESDESNNCMEVTLIGPEDVSTTSTTPKPQPSPTSCKTGVNSFSVEEECGKGLYRYANYSCHDSTSGKLGGPTSCKPSETWSQYVQDACKGRSQLQCLALPSISTPISTSDPTPVPTPSPKPIQCGDSAGDDGYYTACKGDSIQHYPSGLIAKVIEFDADYVTLDFENSDIGDLRLRRREWADRTNAQMVTIKNGTQVSFEYNYLDGNRVTIKIDSAEVQKISPSESDFTVTLTSSPRSTNGSSHENGYLAVKVGDKIQFNWRIDTKDLVAKGITDSSLKWIWDTDVLDCSSYPNSKSSNFVCKVIRDTSGSVVYIGTSWSNPQGGQMSGESNMIKVYTESQSTAPLPAMPKRPMPTPTVKVPLPTFDTGVPSAGYEDEVVTAQARKNPFSDTDLNTLVGQAAANLHALGIIGGYPDGTFKGERSVNRAEAAKFLLLSRYSASALQEIRNDGKFWDVLDGQWYTRFIINAYLKGLMSGYPDGSMGPGKNVNTVEFLKMLSLNFALPLDLSYSYQDVPRDSWFAPYAGIAQQYNLFPERKGKLFPASELTRAEVAVALYQYLSKH